MSSGYLVLTILLALLAGIGILHILTLTGFIGAIVPG